MTRNVQKNLWPFSDKRTAPRNTTPASGGIAAHTTTRKTPTKATPALIFKGARIYQEGDVWKIQGYSGEQFDTAADAKRFVSDEVKMRRNPSDIPVVRIGQTGLSRSYVTLAAVRKAKKRGEGREIVQVLDSHGKRVAYALRNPKRRNSAQASDAMYQSFHGQEPDGEVLVEETEHVHDNLAVIGPLIQIRVDCVTGVRATLDFEDDPPFLCTNEEGTQLYIEAGDQTIDLEGLGFRDSEWIKDRMVIGKFSPPAGKDEQWNIGYQTEKDFDDFETILYQHDLGEETAINGKAKKVAEDQRVRPMLEYDPINEKLFITGGKYIIKQPLFETSPGIEN